MVEIKRGTGKAPPKKRVCFWFRRMVSSPDFVPFTLYECGNGYKVAWLLLERYSFTFMQL